MRIDRIKIVTLMAQREITGKKLSEISGISRAVISGIRCGKTCSQETANKISKALGVDVALLLSTSKEDEQNA